MATQPKSAAPEPKPKPKPNPVGTDKPQPIAAAVDHAVQHRPTTKPLPPAGLHPDTVTVSIIEACKILSVGRPKTNELIKTDLEIKRIVRRSQIIAESIRGYLARP